MPKKGKRKSEKGTSSKQQRKEMKEEAKQKKVAEQKAIATMCKLINEMSWTKGDGTVPTLRQEERIEETKFGGLQKTGKKVKAWSDTYYPCKEAVAAILLSASDKKAKGCDFEPTYKKEAKGSKKGEEGQVDAAPPTIRPNSFGGQYSPFLPLATLGAAITIGDRSALSLGAMTVAGLVTAIQLNNAQADCGLNGLRKCREERAFDAAKTYLLVAFDNIGKLDVQHDDDDSDNDDEKVSGLHPTWFGETEAAATRSAISILRVGAPEKMIKLAQLSVDDAVIKAAVDKMAKHQKAWGALSFTREETDASTKKGYQPWARGSDKKNQQKEVYQDSSKSLSLNEKKEFVTDQSSVFTYYTWSRHATPKAAADEGGGD